MMEKKETDTKIEEKMKRKGGSKKHDNAKEISQKIIQT